MARGPLAGPAGPGKFSTRTDGLSFQSPEYGAGVENAANLAGAPLAKTADVRGATNTEVRQAATRKPVTKLFDPSERPEDSLEGAASRPMIQGGIGTQEKLSDILATMLPYDQTGEVEILYQRALARGM
jgi:hypothetical protein